MSNLNKVFWVLTGGFFLLLPNIVACGGGSPDRNKAAQMSWELSTEYGMKADGKGDYINAQLYFKEALRKAEKFDSKDPRLPTSLRNLARAYRAENKFPGAESLLKRVVDIRARELGLSHPELISVQEELGALYAEQGKGEEALPLLSWEMCAEYGMKAEGEGDHIKGQLYFKEALRKAEKFDPGDPRLSTSLHNLARAYQSGNKLADAELLLKRVIDMRAEELGTSHPDVLSVQGELSALYADQGRISLISWELCTQYGMKAEKEGDHIKAQLYFKEALRKAERFDAGDPRLPASLHNLAKNYLAENNFTDAEPLLKRVVDIRAGELGPLHPEVISIQEELGVRYAALGKDNAALSWLSWEKCTEYGVRSREKNDYVKAHLYFTEALNKAEKFDSKDPRLLASLRNLAGNYLAENKLADAELLLKRVVDIRVAELGPSHPDVISIQRELGALYVTQGKDIEALSLLSWEKCTEQGVKAREKGDYIKAHLYFTEALHKAEKFDSKDPRLPTTRKNMVIAHLNVDKLAEVESLTEKHPEVLPLLSWEETAECGAKMARKGNYAVAQRCFTAALHKAEKFNSKDPRLLYTLNNFAKAHQAQGHLAEAESLYKRILAIFEGSPESADLSATLNNLAGICYAQGRFDEAESLFKRALSIRLKELGPSHTDVIVSRNNLATLYIAQKRFPEAEKILNDSITVIKKNDGPVPLMISLLENYATVLQALKRNDEAEKTIRQFTRLKNNISIKDMERLG